MVLPRAVGSNLFAECFGVVGLVGCKDAAAEGYHLVVLGFPELVVVLGFPELVVVFGTWEGRLTNGYLEKGSSLTGLICYLGLW